MNLVFGSWRDIPFNENYIKQLHQILLRHSDKDIRHRGQYKTHSNSVAAFDENGIQIGIVFETATPFDTPRLMTEQVTWVNNEGTIRTESPNWQPWLLFFLRSLAEQVRRLEKKVEREKMGFEAQCNEKDT